MPRKTGTKQKRMKKYNTYAKTGLDVANTAFKAYQLASRVASLVNVEKKKFDRTSTDTPSTNGNITAIHGIVQGDLAQNRNGNSIKPTGITLKGVFTPNAAATNTICTMYIVQDLQQEPGVTPAVTDFLDVTYGGLALLNQLQVGRFKILYKKKMAQDGNRPINIDAYIPLKNTHIRYSGSAATTVQKGGMYVVLISNQATNTPTIQWVTRLSFIDN